ncbi:MAG: AmmeMemoRadiSam system radical SAM enzyme [Candidatus Alcyoniella australis]|nr:AmmeMemoRadiSam system radical SAM enzyme [Candidatus Alcyoniella australis]
METKRAEYYEELGNGVYRCLLCPRHCLIAPGKRGQCTTRLNDAGVLLADNYGVIASSALDPIEKKPLYHVRPGSRVLSVGGLGCTLDCDFCQNWSLKNGAERDAGRRVAARELADNAGREGSVGLAYTYNEPVVWFEYLMDVMPLVREQGLLNILVTNGYAEPDPWDRICSLSDAMNIDLKSFRQEFYHEVCSGRLDTVRRNIERAVELGVHVEVTTLLVTDLNDSESEMRDLTRWLATVDPSIPFHISRYFPNYRRETPPTPLPRLQRALQIARERLRYVYLGNVASATGADTDCYNCGAKLVRRSGYSVRIERLEGGCCGDCGADAKMLR